jgi:hypothetical protein
VSSHVPLLTGARLSPRAKLAPATLPGTICRHGPSCQPDYTSMSLLVPAEVGISRVILYRHFESKADLYRAALERARARLVAAVGAVGYTPGLHLCSKPK